jgi:chromosome segregation ATPase
LRQLSVYEEEMNRPNFQQTMAEECDQLGRQIRARDEEISELRHDISVLQRGHEFWKKAAESREQTEMLIAKSYQESLSGYQSTIDRLTTELQESENRSQGKLEQCKQLIEQKTAKSVEQICRLERELEKNAAEKATLKKEISDRQFELQKMKMRMDARAEAYEREKQLIDMQMKARILSFETELAALGEEQKQIWQDERRDLIGIVVSEFAEFADNQGEFDQEFLKRCVCRVKKELERQRGREKVIRRLIRADDYEPLDGALMRFTISNDPRFDLA